MTLHHRELRGYEAINHVQDFDLPWVFKNQVNFVPLVRFSFLKEEAPFLVLFAMRARNKGWRDDLQALLRENDSDG